MTTAARLGRVAGYGIAIVMVGLWAWQYVSAPPAAIDRLAGLDYDNYAEATRSWMNGGTW